MLVVSWAACAGTLAGFLARWGWPFELASHFRLQYAWASLISACVLLVTHRFQQAAVPVGGLLINLWAIAPLCVARASRGLSGAVRVVSANVLWSNRSYERLRRFIRQTDPDLVLLVEITEDWLMALREIESGYAFSRAVIQPNGYGIVLWSRFPVREVEVRHFGACGPPSLVTRVSLPDHSLVVIGTHAPAPTTPARARLRNQQLAELAVFASAQEGPLLLLGDLNTTSWSSAFQDLLRVARLRDSRQGFGLQPTWPVWMPLLRIPIDHCLASRGIVVQSRRVGAYIGSDHYPILVDVTMERASAPASSSDQP